MTVIGNLLVASATASYQNSSTQVIVQIASSIIGVTGAFILAFWDYEFLAKKFKWIVAADIFLLVLVLILGTGAEEVGGKSWIRIGPIGIQPSELVKIGFILSFSYQLDKIYDNVNKFVNVILCLLHIGIITGLIMMQPDFGTTMVFLAIFTVMIFSAKISWKYILSAVGIIGISIPVLWKFFFKEYQKNRILTFFNSDLDNQFSGYQVMQSKTAIGGGQAFGQGLFKGILTQNELLPAKHTDFIFAVAGEELGFIGAILIVFLIVFIVVKCYIIAFNAKEPLGYFIAIGVGTMLLVQSFENIGMTVGLTPVTGITLPFLSYGGSSMVTNYLAIGLVLNVRIRNKKLNFTL